VKGEEEGEEGEEEGEEYEEEVEEEVEEGGGMRLLMMVGCFETVGAGVVWNFGVCFLDRGGFLVLKDFDGESLCVEFGCFRF